MNAEAVNSIFGDWDGGTYTVSSQADELKKMFTDIRVLAEQDSTSQFFSHVLNPSICVENFDPTNFEFQTEFDRSIKSRVCFREFVDQFGVKHLRFGEQVELEHHDTLVTSTIKFLKCWYEIAFEKLSSTHFTSAEVREMLPILEKQLHSLSPSSPSNSCDKSVPRKVCNVIDKLGAYEQMHLTPANCRAIHELIVSLYQDVQDCEFSLQIEEFFKNKAPDYRNLLKTATEEMRLYKQCNIDAVESARETIDSLNHALHRMNEFRKQGPGLSEEWFQDSKSWKRFCFLKGILAKMHIFAKTLSLVNQSNVSYVMSQILAPEKQAPQISAPEKQASRAMILFTEQFFNLVCIFFTVIVEVNTNWPNSRNPRDVECWKSLEQNIKIHADYRTGVLHRLSCAANEAAALWLQAEMSGFCYDVCQYTVAKSDQSSFTKLNRVENLAVDMHPDCEDIIGMRVWFTDHVSTGGFNQRLEQSGSACGVLIVHVFLRYDRAISRPGKTQAKFYSGSCACGNVQLPSWIEEACASRLFYQPLLDYLIHDYFDYKLADPKREPIRLVFTGAAFDAVLATVIASELISALVSYREEHEVLSQHPPSEWDSLFNHIRSSVFVLSFMLPAVFSRHHFLPVSSKKNSLGGSIIAPHENLGINMLNITFHSCICSKLVEVWLSIDRDIIAESDDASLWKETSQFDSMVLLLLEKITSSCRKSENFDSSINESLFKIIAKAKTLMRNQKAKLDTFVADYKQPSSIKFSLLKSGKVPFRYLDSLGKKQKHVLHQLEKVSKRRDFVSHGHFWPGMLTFVQDPHKLLNCNMNFPHGHFEDGDSLENTHRKMDMIASWFFPIASVYEIGPRKISPSQPPVGRQSGSYGVAPRGSKQSSELSSRMSVKPLRSSTDPAKGPDRLLVQWCCDSVDSQAITCNCFAVR
jgi:hypothetical protein